MSPQHRPLLKNESLSKGLAATALDNLTILQRNGVLLNNLPAFRASSSLELKDVPKLPPSSVFQGGGVGHRPWGPIHTLPSPPFCAVAQVHYGVECGS